MNCETIKTVKTLKNYESKVNWYEAEQSQKETKKALPLYLSENQWMAQKQQFLVQQM